ncbi:Porin subfamily protein [Mesorhizobium albiziae]|uniref:Porin n=1 Tax=Neomesorhizobium albiziae TaxID=335020 RepID=A0A1I4ANE4_9HYPH|nr:porin [Mesorhizobium albiziae]GLS32982.1 porin [Mesorhizobium albiziae]SFK58042.1 Porin subfamily protein [Mesorhizobium albiziae]
MNIKSLLLGSAAALVAVSGARAADAVVVAEPEPVEYVRVCDVYGTGFYYMPGTETCLKVSGYVRYDIGVGEDGFLGQQSFDKLDLLEDGVVDINDTYYKRARAALRLDARTETELGTLRAYFQINFNYDADQGNLGTIDTDGDGVADTDLPFVETNEEVAINHAYIELGGFLVGKTDSFFTTFTDYAGTIINDDLIPYGPFDTHTIQYKFDAGNGFTAGIALEEGTGTDDVLVDIDADGDLDFVSADVYTLDSFMPHVAAGVGYTAGWGGVKVVAGYDSVWEQFAVKGRLDVKATEALSLFVMAGWKDSDDFDIDGDGVADITNLNFYGNWGGDWAIWGGGRFVVSPKTAVNVQISYDDFENFVAVGNVDYELVPGFTITPEVVYIDNFADDAGDDADSFGGFLRFQRNF